MFQDVMYIAITLVFLALIIYRAYRDLFCQNMPEVEDDPLIEQDDDPELDRLEKLEKVYNHFGYEHKYGLTFPDYVRKVNAGTWHELAENQ